MILPHTLSPCSGSFFLKTLSISLMAIVLFRLHISSLLVLVICGFQAIIFIPQIMEFMRVKLL